MFLSMKNFLFLYLKKKKRYIDKFFWKYIYIYKFYYKWSTIFCKRFCYDNGIQIRRRKFSRHHQSRLESTNESLCVTLAILIIERLRCVNLCVNLCVNSCCWIRDIFYQFIYITMAYLKISNFSINGVEKLWYNCYNRKNFCLFSTFYW